jgi:hypothetical protein
MRAHLLPSTSQIDITSQVLLIGLEVLELSSSLVFMDLLSSILILEYIKGWAVAEGIMLVAAGNAFRNSLID